MQLEEIAYGISTMSARDILADNIQRLMEANPALSSLVKVAAQAKRKGHTVSKNAVDSAKSGSHAVNMDTLDGIARAFEMEAWQLLVPNMNPNNPPVLRSIGETEDEMYKRLRSAAAEIVAMGLGGRDDGR